MKHETYILSNKLYNVVNIYTKSVQVKSYNMYIIGGLRVILVAYKVAFFSGLL